MAGYHHGNLREALKERAVSIINDSGVGAVSLRGIARDLGVSHAAPARHFATRDDLLRAIAIDDAQAMVDAVLTAIGEADDDPFARLAAAARAYVDWIARNATHFRVVRNPEVSRLAHGEIAERIGGLAARLRSDLAQAQAQGWRPDVPLPIVMFQFMSTLVGAATLATDPIYGTIEGEGADREAMFEDVLERMLA